MKQFSDYDILMVYLGECEDENLKQEILASPLACQQLAELENDMSKVESNINQNDLDSDYGQNLWNHISNKLEPPEYTKNWFESLSALIFAPRFSMAGLAVVFVAAISFYLIGAYDKNIVLKSNTHQHSKQLLAQNLQYHLIQTDLFLTQVSNMPEQSQSKMMLNTANYLLSSNRIFKTAFNNDSNNPNIKIKQLLTELDQVLTEISNSTPDQKQDHIYQYTHNQLLYKVKSFTQQLKSERPLI